jgi:predicted PP-loop superfamily ATPase
MSKLRASIQLTGTFFSENLTPKSGRHKVSVEKMIFWNQNKWEIFFICPILNERRNQGCPHVRRLKDGR